MYLNSLSKLSFGLLMGMCLTACQPNTANQQQASQPADNKQPNTTAQTQTNNSAQPNNTQGKKVRVASELSKFPVVMHDGQGKVTGFEAELLQAVAEKQGFVIEYNIDSWAGILNKLTGGDADMVLGSVTITEERRQTMDFTEPVLPYQTGLMVRPSFSNAKQFSDLRGKRVNLRKNTVYEKLVPIFSSNDGSNMVYPDNVWGQVKSLLADESDAMVGASITLEYYQAQYADRNFHIIYEPGSPISYYGWAVKKGDTALLNELNQGLEKVKSDGTYQQLYKKYWPNSKLDPLAPQ